jgi:hypothetical protein
MLKLFEKKTGLVVELCERCSQVCATGCRAGALLERARMQALRFGGRV